MATVTNKTHRSRRRLTWRSIVLFVLIMLGTPVLGVLLLLAWLAIRDASAHSQLAAEIEELRAAGLPYDDASVANYYADATDDRDVDEWLEVLADVNSNEFAQASKGIGPWDVESSGRVPFASKPWPEEDRTREFLESWSDLRTKARRLALQDRRVRLPIEFHGLNTDLSLTQQVRQLSRLFLLEAQVAIRDRDSAATRDAILALFGCARAVEGQPILISQLVSMAHDHLAIDELRCAVREDVLERAELQAVLARLHKRPNWAASWKRAISGELGGMLPTFIEQREYIEDMPFNLPWRSRDALTYVQTMKQAADAPAEDLNVFYSSVESLDRTVHEKIENANILTRFDTMLFSVAMPGTLDAAKAFIRRETLARLAMLGIGIRLYEDEHGALPDRLEQLSEIGLDVPKLTPLGDKPFGYRKEQERAILWGVHISDQQSTPAEPPSIVKPSDGEPVTDSKADWNRSWVWEFFKHVAAGPVRLVPQGTAAPCRWREPPESGSNTIREVLKGRQMAAQICRPFGTLEFCSLGGTGGSRHRH